LKYISFKNILSSLIVLLTIISVNQWSIFPIGNTYTNWIIYSIITILFVKGIKYYYDESNLSNLLFVKLYLIWVIISSTRGIFEAQNYWDFKSLINSGLALLMIVSIYIFTNPLVIKAILSKWLMYAFPLFFVLMFFLTTDSYGFYLMPISFFLLFLPFFDKKWRVAIVLISLFVVLVDLDARSNVIKFFVPFLFSFLFYIKRLVNFKLFKIIFFASFFFPFFFLFLGITNKFNIFQIDKYISGNFEEKKKIGNQVKVADLKSDTRTFLYKEVIVSAIKNDYMLMGRSPARGNESDAFGLHAAEELKTGRYERYGNEVSILNIFTWTGLVGVILYFLVFLKAAYLAITKSNSNFLRIIGLYVTFRWIYLWVEDPNIFNINNILLWMVVAMCYSEQFRNMSDFEFKNWLSSIFKSQPNLIRDN
jgi:hypothetical protein